MPADKATNYRYDLDDRLIRVGTNTTSTTMQYLPDGLRYQKTQGNAITRYGYDHWNRITSDQQADGTTSQYVRGDRVLMKKDLTHGKDYDYLYNGHGDVVQIVGTDGTVLNSYQYDEWGNLTQQKEAIDNEFKYAGELYDAETGLYYLKARYYDPKQGRFLNEDSDEGQIDNPLSMNVYTYVHNNPLIYIDPSGNSSEPSLEKTTDGNFSGGSTSSGTGSSKGGGKGGGGSGSGGGSGKSGGGSGRSSTSSNSSSKTEKQEVEKSDVVAESDSATNASKLQEEQLQVKQYKVDNNYTGKAFKGERNPEVDFTRGNGTSTLQKHFDDHGGEFGYANETEYLNGAREFLEKSPTSTTQSFVSNEGTYFRYDTATNEFGIINKYGGVSTYFKPDEKLEYWKYQIKLYAPD